MDGTGEDMLPGQGPGTGHGRRAGGGAGQVEAQGQENTTNSRGTSGRQARAAQGDVRCGQHHGDRRHGYVQRGRGHRDSTSRPGPRDVRRGWRQFDAVPGGEWSVSLASLLVSSGSCRFIVALKSQMAGVSCTTQEYMAMPGPRTRSMRPGPWARRGRGHWHVQRGHWHIRRGRGQGQVWLRRAGDRHGRGVTIRTQSGLTLLPDTIGRKDNRIKFIALFAIYFHATLDGVLPRSPTLLLE